MTSAEIWENMEQSLNRAAVTDPLRNLSALNSTIALRKLAHRQDLAARLTEMEKGSELRMKEAKESERLRMINDFAREGAPVTTDMTEDEANSVRHDWMTKRASNVLNTFKVQIQGAQDREEAALRDIQRVANSAALGSKEQRLQALRTALEDPSSRKLPDDVRANLWKILDNKQDPAKAMDDAVQRMQSFWGSKGILPSTRYGYASAFLSAYTTPLQSAATQQQKDRLAIGMQQLSAATKEKMDLQHQAFTHIGANAAWLPASAAADFSKETGFNQDPNAIMGKTQGTGTQPAGGGGADESDQTPGSAGDQSVGTAPPASRPSGLPPVPTGRTVTPQAQAAWMSATPGFGGSSVSGIPAPSAPGLGQAIGESVMRPGYFDQAAKAPSQMEVLHFAAQRDLQANPNPKAIPHSPQEEQKVEQMFRTWATSNGAQPEDVDKQIQIANQKIAQGDPEAIAMANRMLLAIRKGSNMPTGANVPGSAPVSQPSQPTLGTGTQPAQSFDLTNAPPAPMIGGQ